MVGANCPTTNYVVDGVTPNRTLWTDMPVGQAPKLLACAGETLISDPAIELGGFAPPVGNANGTAALYATLTPSGAAILVGEPRTEHAPPRMSTSSIRCPVRARSASARSSR